MHRVLCVITQVLGNRTYGDALLSAVAAAPGFASETVTFGADDYARYPASGVARFGSWWEARDVFLRKLRSEPLPPHDMILCNGLGLGLELLRLRPGIPLALATDTTPRLIRGQNLAATGSAARRLLLRASGALQDRDLRRAAPRIRTLLPWSSWCRNSLVEDYGAAPERCRVTLAPVQLPATVARRAAGPLRLLFVGNDFRRKGGSLLLKVMELLGSDFRLTIVSNDPALAAAPLPAGATVRAGLRTAAEVAPLYLEHDLFVFPSRIEQFGLVLGEAAAAGLPCVSAGVGGIRDMVDDGVSGVVLSPDASVTEWAAAIRGLGQDESRRARMAEAARQVAESRLDASRFNAVIREVLEDLRTSLSPMQM